MGDCGASLVTPESSSDRALRPLWGLAGGTAAGAVAALATIGPTPSVLVAALAIAGGVAAVVGLATRPHSAVLWLMVGLALGGGRALAHRADELVLEGRQAASGPLALRVEGTVREAWRPMPWGFRTRLAVASSRHRGETVDLPRTVSLEVRGANRIGALPLPGAGVRVLAELRGTPRRPLLVSSSPRLLEITAPPHGLDALRERAAARLLAVAGTDADRIRAAEMAAALVLGRRDLLPAARQEAWRRSGLGHLLAVSGLHVGVVAGTLWLMLALTGLRPNAVRVALLLAVPAYALLAGASPSALRAALMAAVWLGARLIGRAPLPMAAVLLAATAMVAVSPTLVGDAGFQLTVLVTAALVRWTPAVAAHLPGPRPVATAVAVPITAQVAAAPLIAWHFRRIAPGTLAANLVAAPLLAPTLVTAAVATASAGLFAPIARVALDALGVLIRALWWAGGAARAVAWTAPRASPAVILVLAAVAVLALLPGRPGRLGALAWLAALAGIAAWTVAGPCRLPDGVTLLPVGEGTATLLAATGPRVLVDGGRDPVEASRLLADAGVRRLETVVASHPDADHIGGIPGILDDVGADRLVLPRWAMADPESVPLLRAARRRGTAVVPVAAGTTLRSGAWRLDVLWPPASAPTGNDNERSLVVRASAAGGTALITSDIGTETERTLAAHRGLRCNVLIVPHHGSRTSTSAALLAAAVPSIALIPAGPHNTHHHPSPSVIARLREARVPYRYPARDGWCGATPAAGLWRAWP